MAADGRGTAAEGRGKGRTRGEERLWKASERPVNDEDEDEDEDDDNDEGDDEDEAEEDEEEKRYRAEQGRQRLVGQT